MTKTSRQGKLRLYVCGKQAEITTGRSRAADRQTRINKLLERGHAAMFFLARQTNPGKRVDVAGVFTKAPTVLEANVRAASARG